MGRVLECRIRLSARNNYTPQDMLRVEDLANDLLSSCQKYPEPRPKPTDKATELILWRAFDSTLRAKVTFSINCGLL